MTSADCSARTARKRAEKLRIAGTGPNQNHRTGLLRDRGCQQGVQSGFGRLAVGCCERLRRKLLPELPPAAKRQRERLHPRAPIARGLRPARESCRDQRFDPGADGLCEDRRSPAGRYAPITSGERLTMAPNVKSENAGRSMTLTGTPAMRANDAKRAASSSSEQSATARAVPEKSSAAQPRARCVTAAARRRFGEREYFITCCRRVNVDGGSRRQIAVPPSTPRPACRRQR